MSAWNRALRIATLAGAAGGGLFAYARYGVRRFEDLEPESAGAPGSFVDVDGVRIHYVEAGRGETVVLIHGLNASTFSFRHTIPELAQHYRVVALDLKGFGYSARPVEGDFSLTAQADLVAQVMAQLGIERAAVVGHSMGGAVAMRLALRSPERVTRLVLVASATDRELRRGLRSARFVRPFLPVAAFLILHRERFRRKWLETAVHDPAHLTPEVREGHLRPSRMKGHLRALGALLTDRRLDEPLAPEAIRQPTRILWGEDDRWLPPASGEELARTIPNARFDLVPGAGHLVLEEQPDYCNRALPAFLRSPAPGVAPTQPEHATTSETAS